MRTLFIPRFRSLPAYLILLLILSGTALGDVRISYLVSPIPPREGSSASTRVEMRIRGLSSQGRVQLQMPVWSPGDYSLQNHALHVKELTAKTEEGTPLETTRPDPNTWQVETKQAKEILIRYLLPNTPRGNFTENVLVRERYAFYNGTALYLYLVGHKTAPVTLAVALPDGWNQALTTLEPIPLDLAQPNRILFSAPDYDTLADSPLLAGEYVTRTFQYAQRPHILAFFGAYQGTDFDGYTTVVQKIVQEQNRLMGGPPYERYVFFFDVNGRGGGLEHLNGTRIAIYRQTPARLFAGIISHEFFHLWNVKRIRPISLGPFDYIHPPKTRNLWFCEGVTEYYAMLTLLRAGLQDREAFFDGVSNLITSLQSQPNRLRVTADESSWRVWETRHSSGYGISYYLKGALIGLCLDLKIRHLTGNRRSLDEVMRDMLHRYGLPKPGFQEDGIREAVMRAAGAEMGPFYDRLARSLDEMPFDECLAYAGLRLLRSGRAFRIAEDPQASDEAAALRESWLSRSPER
jgi:predicted metalloprotease with PDZ domain